MRILRAVPALTAFAAVLLCGCGNRVEYSSMSELQTERAAQLQAEAYEWVARTDEGGWIRWDVPGDQAVLELISEQDGRVRVERTLLFASEEEATAGLARELDGGRVPDLSIDAYRADRPTELSAVEGRWIGNTGGGHVYGWFLPGGDVVLDKVTRNPAGGIRTAEIIRFSESPVPVEPAEPAEPAEPPEEEAALPDTRPVDEQMADWFAETLDIIDTPNFAEYRELRADELGAEIDWGMNTRGWILYGWLMPDGTYRLDILREDTETAGVELEREYDFATLAEMVDWVDQQLLDRASIWSYWNQMRYWGILPSGTVLLVSFFILFNISRARKSKDITIRRIAGLDQIDEAVGRATETARPVLMVPGLGGLDGITVQALTIFANIVRTTARFMTPIRLLNYNAAVFAVAQKIVHDVYVTEGMPEQFDVDSVRFVSDRQFAFAAAVAGIIQRERVAATFFMGDFFAESMIFAENANMVGAIQVAATTQVTQTPFFIAACDYVLLGDEFYAASAYLGREPILLGSLVGVDWAKMMFIAFAGVAVVWHSVQATRPIDPETLPAVQRQAVIDEGQQYIDWRQDAFFKWVMNAARD